MDKSQYWAKNDGTTLEEHICDLMVALDEIRELGYITSEELYKLVKLAIEYHDLGKVNREFQHRVRNTIKHLRFNPEKEIIHNVLSLYFISEEKVKTINPSNKKNYYRVCLAVLFHHNYGDTMELLRENEDRGLEILKEFEKEIFQIPQNLCRALSVLMTINDEKTVKLKGFLHKCDYAASGHYKAEYINDFLEVALEHEIVNLRKQQPDAHWNDLQCFCKEKQNQNIIAVAQTGMGKTEAGLLWIGNHKGFFILPLRTAINAIYDRICMQMLEDSAKISEQVGILHSERLEYYISHMDASDEDLYEYAKRGKQLSLPINISTVDQLFDFIFQYPGYELKLTTLSYSRIVIDEIQMYNAELLAYLIFGLEKITQMGGKVAILTATLPPFVKELLEQHIDIPKENQKMFLDKNKQARHHIKVCDEKINAKDILNLYLKNKSENKSNKILVVCNKIKTAQRLFDDIKELLQYKRYNDEEIRIFHSRFTQEDREKLEKEIIEFGQPYDKDGNIDMRDGIWITTSVVEVSLDIDFDYLVTELKDLCSLFQRMGRCNRKGLKKLLELMEPNCYIYTEIDEVDLIKEESEKKAGSRENKKEKSKGRIEKENFIDEVIYKLSREAISGKDGIITESQKIELLNQYFTMENIQNSNFMTIFQKTYNDMIKVEAYDYGQNEKQLREILEKTIIPSPIYENESIQKEILDCAEKLKQSDLSIVQRQKLRSQIMRYTVSVPQYHWRKYEKALDPKANSERKAKKYSSISLGKYEKINIMECNYDEKGYSPIY